jgi:hypothetical protein
MFRLDNIFPCVKSVRTFLQLRLLLLAVSSATAVAFLRRVVIVEPKHITSSLPLSSVNRLACCFPFTQGFHYAELTLRCYFLTLHEDV